MPGFPITAYSACNGLGQTTAEVLDGLFAGRRGLTPADASLGVATWVGAIPGELPPLDRRLLGFESRQARIAQLVTVPLLGAVERAKQRWGAGRVGLILGTSTAGIAETERAFVAHRETGSLPPEFALERQHALYATVEIVQILTGVRGPSYVVSTACSSSGKVFASAERLLRTGIVDAVVVGGIDSLCQLTVRGFASLEVLSTEPCRPFSSERRGINIGEGGALLLLERRSSATDAQVVLLGVGESSDAHHMTAPHPEGLGARMAMERALARARVSADEVDQINVHGTGTTLNDETESRAIRDLFGDMPSRLSVVATKGYTGHMLGAAGATEAVFVAATIERGELPASIGADPVDPSLQVPIELVRRQRATRRVLSNSLAFGGSNVSVLLGAAE